MCNRFYESDYRQGFFSSVDPKPFDLQQVHIAKTANNSSLNFYLVRPQGRRNVSKSRRVGVGVGGVCIIIVWYSNKLAVL